ncbi:MAG: hypothetical protein OJF47_003186 [Nitrospira sp.]|nr:MAG: hypothetical protein OJF47_003186 [Nitrospira sp.]
MLNKEFRLFNAVPSCMLRGAAHRHSVLTTSEPHYTTR